jgi:hypothetical protein
MVSTTLPTPAPLPNSNLLACTPSTRQKNVSCGMMDNWSSYPGEATVYSANPAPGSNDPVLDLCEVNSGQQQALLQHGET